MKTDQNDMAEKLEVARLANHQISQMASLLKRVISEGEHYTDEEAAWLGMLSRIETLSEIVFHGARLGGDESFIGLQHLQHAYDGSM